jgi:hypothetical protein
MAAAGGTTTGGTPITVAVAINGGSDICGGGLQIATGTGARAGSVFELNMIGGSTNPAAQIFEGDLISWTPSGGTGASIPGAFGLVIRKA